MFVLIGVLYKSGVRYTYDLSLMKLIRSMASATQTIAQGRNISHISPLISLLKNLTLFYIKAVKIKWNLCT